MEDGRLAKPGVVGTVMSNLGLERYLDGLGLSLVRTPVGDRYVLEHMREHGYNVGGEQSGHIILSDYTTTGDGLRRGAAGARRGEEARQPVSKVCHRFDAAAAGDEERALQAAASRSRTPRSAARSTTPKPASTAMAAW